MVVVFHVVVATNLVLILVSCFVSIVGVVVVVVVVRSSKCFFFSVHDCHSLDGLDSCRRRRRHERCDGPLL